MKTVHVEILNRWTGKVQFACDLEAIKGERKAKTLGRAVLQAYKNDADLRDADLTNADLRRADLIGAVLRGADLTNADLRGADLTNADLTNADLIGADLTNADLIGAGLCGASLYGAVLRGAVLRGADLAGDKNISEKFLTLYRDDLWAVLSAAPFEAEGLRTALAEGRVNGSTYEGPCACLVGTIANLRGVHYRSMDFIKPNSRRPAEQWFMGIRLGDKPENNDFSRHALEWTDQWIASMRAAFAV